MLSLSPATRIFVAVEPVDMRRSFNGLSAHGQAVLQQDVLSGHLFVYTTRLRTRVKLVYWDGSGLWVSAKRLEKGTCGWPAGHGASVCLRPEEWQWLLHGIDGRPRPHWYRRGARRMFHWTPRSPSGRLGSRSESLVVQGRAVTAQDLDRLRALVAAHPHWSRRRLSDAVCAEWDWRNAAGRLKDMATRTLLGKLEARGLITLPARRRIASNRMADRPVPTRVWDLTPLTCALREGGPLVVEEVSRDRSARADVAAALSAFHYLGSRGTVGENLQSTIRDQAGRLLACLLFGSAAWTGRTRDAVIGWTPAQRAAHLSLLTNNTRFLILPFVKVPHLASWILGRVLRQLSDDWQQKYGHPIALVETFVERDRFRGTSYTAANWIRLGATTGRSRQDRDTTLHVPVKDVHVYPLCPDVRQVLCA